MYMISLASIMGSASFCHLLLCNSLVVAIGKDILQLLSLILCQPLGCVNMQVLFHSSVFSSRNSRSVDTTNMLSSTEKINEKKAESDREKQVPNDTTDSHLHSM